MSVAIPSTFPFLRRALRSWRDSGRLVFLKRGKIEALRGSITMLSHPPQTSFGDGYPCKLKS